MQTASMESLNKKRVLITGNDSYVGTSVKRYLEQTPELFEARELDVRIEEWKEASFEGYDVVFHVAGIVHRKKAPEELYFKVNRDLTIEMAEKAKLDGVGQFIFMSTIAVYGMPNVMGKENCITKDTEPDPKTPYGKSKLEAERGIQAMADENFGVCILRPPMIYGEGCPGNYQALKKIVMKFGVIPVVENERSVAHINTLCGYVKQCIVDNKRGLYFPQDKEYANTSDMMKKIAQEQGRNVYESRLLGMCVRAGAVFLPVLRKAFGNLTISCEDVNQNKEMPNSKENVLLSNQADEKNKLKNKNIWIINHHSMPPFMGPFCRHYYFAKYLKKNGYSVKIFTASQIHNTNINMATKREKYAKKNYDDVEYVFIYTDAYTGKIKKRAINMLQFSSKLWKTCKNYPTPDIIYTSSPDIFAAARALKIAKNLGVPSIFEVRDLWPESIVEFAGYRRNNLLIQLLYMLEKWCYKTADRIIFTMQGGEMYIRDKGWDSKIDNRKIYHINNGIDLADFNKNMKDIKRSDEGCLFTVTYAGAIRKVNGLGILVDTAKILKHRGHLDIILRIYGTGDEVDILKKRVEAENISTISFEGYKSRTDMPSILSSSDVNILHYRPSNTWRYGSSNNKLFEYFAAGKPVLSTIKTGYSIIEKYKAGITAQDCTPDAIANAILQLKDCPTEEYQIYCENAKRAALDFTFEVLSEKLIDVIESV